MFASEALEHRAQRRQRRGLGAVGSVQAVDEAHLASAGQPHQGRRAVQERCELREQRPVLVLALDGRGGRAPDDLGRQRFARGEPCEEPLPVRRRGGIEPELRAVLGEFAAERHRGGPAGWCGEAPVRVDVQPRGGRGLLPGRRLLPDVGQVHDVLVRLPSVGGAGRVGVLRRAGRKRCGRGRPALVEVCGEAGDGVVLEEERGVQLRAEDGLQLLDEREQRGGLQAQFVETALLVDRAGGDAEPRREQGGDQLAQRPDASGTRRSGVRLGRADGGRGRLGGARRLRFREAGEGVGLAYPLGRQAVQPHHT